MPHICSLSGCFLLQIATNRLRSLALADDVAVLDHYVSASELTALHTGDFSQYNVGASSSDDP